MLGLYFSFLRLISFSPVTVRAKGSVAGWWVPAKCLFLFLQRSKTPWNKIWLCWSHIHTVKFVQFQVSLPCQNVSNREKNMNFPFHAFSLPCSSLVVLSIRAFKCVLEVIYMLCWVLGCIIMERNNCLEYAWIFNKCQRHFQPWMGAF